MVLVGLIKAHGQTPGSGRGLVGLITAHGQTPRSGHGFGGFN